MAVSEDIALMIGLGVWRLRPGVSKAGPTYIQRNLFNPRVVHASGLLYDASCDGLANVIPHHQGKGVTGSARQ